jgi:hypothetical protein
VEMMKLREYPTSAIIGMNDDNKQLLKLFVLLNGTTISKLTNQLYRQYFFNNLASLELQYPDKMNDWNNIRELLHK